MTTDRSLPLSIDLKVYLAEDAHNHEEVAIKVCEKRLIRREKKHAAVLREKKCLTLLTASPSPFFIKLYCTFQDENRLCKLSFIWSLPC